MTSSETMMWYKSLLFYFLFLPGTLHCMVFVPVQNALLPSHIFSMIYKHSDASMFKSSNGCPLSCRAFVARLWLDVIAGLTDHLGS